MGFGKLEFLGNFLFFGNFCRFCFFGVLFLVLKMLLGVFLEFGKFGLLIFLGKLFFLGSLGNLGKFFFLRGLGNFKCKEVKIKGYGGLEIIDLSRSFWDRVFFIIKVNILIMCYFF